MIILPASVLYTATCAAPGDGVALTGLGATVGGRVVADGDRVLLTDTAPGLYVARAGAWDVVQMTYGQVVITVRLADGKGVYTAEIPRSFNYAVADLVKIA